jgi:NAD-dependent deacetylase
MAGFFHEANAWRIEMSDETIYGVSRPDYQGLLLKLRAASSSMVFSGAGLSAESGIPTFRDDPEGVWEKLNPQDYASAKGFARNKLEVWKWYWDRKVSALGCEPNTAHRAIAKLQRVLPTYVGTQNVDGLLTRGGCDPVYEMHGSLFGYKCLACARPGSDEHSYVRDVVPTCTHCGGPMRPAVVWFGEALDLREFSRAEAHAANADVFFSIGTSGEVYPAAALPERAAVFGRTVVIINPAPTEHDRLTPYTFRARAGDFLPRLLADAGLT